MSQALPVLSSAPRPPATGGASSAAETADSGQNFEAALANQRDAGEPAGPESGRAGAPAAADAGPVRETNPAPAPAAVAAGGKDLPPVLPADPAALVVKLLQPDVPGETSALGLPAVSPEAGDVAPETTDAALTALAPVPLPTPTASAPAVTPVPGAAPDPVTAAAASAARAAEPLPVARAETLVSQAATDSLNAMAARVEPAAAGDDPAARLAMLKAATDAGANPTPVDGRAPSASSVGFQTLVNLSGALPNAPAAAPTQAQVNVPVGHPGWGQAFGNQVVWAVNQAMPAASLHLSPPELGPLSVQIRLDQDQASIQFVSAHAAVRDAIEAALPRLREMLGGQGIVLADVNVSQHGQSGHTQRDGSAPAGERGAGNDLPDELVAPTTTRTIGMLDVYA